MKSFKETLDEIHRMPTKLAGKHMDPISQKSLAKQKLTNLIKSGKGRGALIANKMRTLNAGDEIDQEDLDALHEVLSKDAEAGDWIKDFVHSENPKFEGKTKKERIKMALGAYYAKQRTEETELEEAQYAGLEKEDKPGKVKTAVVKMHPKGVESETVEGWKDPKKPVKESYDEEGNLITMTKTYKEFMTEMEFVNGRYVHKGTYGNAGKGANYGETDYDNEDIDKKDDEAGEATKAKRGPKVGSKRGPRTNLGSSKLHQK